MGSDFVGMRRVTKVGILVPFSWSFRGGVVVHAGRQAEALLTMVSKLVYSLATTRRTPSRD
jgi:hypothetical protein